MAEYTREEALTFIEAARVSLEGRVGFKWYAEKLADLGSYVEALADENERLNCFVDSIDARAAYESFRVKG